LAVLLNGAPVVGWASRAFVKVFPTHTTINIVGVAPCAVISVELGEYKKSETGVSMLGRGFLVRLGFSADHEEIIRLHVDLGVERGHKGG
jgi:hypothetical protein